ncbi:MAG: carbohydrate ABC transporter permease [Spirochaetia bacterium]|nr:carbohydrate ABC transporter permease [Spirochaetia bacterium]
MHAGTRKEFSQFQHKTTAGKKIKTGLRHYLAISTKKKKIVKLVVALIATGTYLIPVLWMYISSFKTERDVYSLPPTLIPNPVTFDPIVQTLSSGGIRYFFNSMVIGSFSTFLTLILAAFTGFALARLKKRWVSMIVLVFLIAQMLPTVLRVTPLFIVFNNLRLINTYAAVILANASLTIPFSVILLRTTFLATPQEIEEASLIDGCSHIKSFFLISVPMGKPGLAVAGAMSFVWSFGDFIFSLSFLNKPSMHPATVGLYNFIGAEATSWNNVMAFAGLTALPLILLFLIFQKQIIQGLSTGSFR